MCYNIGTGKRGTHQCTSNPTRLPRMLHTKKANMGIAADLVPHPSKKPMQPDRQQKERNTKDVRYQEPGVTLHRLCKERTGEGSLFIYTYGTPGSRGFFCFRGKSIGVKGKRNTVFHRFFILAPPGRSRSTGRRFPRRGRRSGCGRFGFRSGDIAAPCWAGPGGWVARWNEGHLPVLW